MPPSYLVNWYVIESADPIYQTFESKGYTLVGYSSHIKVTIDLNWSMLKYVRSAWQKNEAYKYKAMISGEAKFAIGCRAFTYNDDRLKLLKWKKYRDELILLFQNNPYKDLGLAMAYKWVKMVKDEFIVGDHTRKYINEHQESHPAKGFTWGQIRKYGLIPLFMRFTKDVVDEWEESFFSPGNWCLSPTTVRRGFRSRSPGAMITIMMLFILWRSRKIGYNPGPSSCLAGIEHKSQVKFVRWMLDIFQTLLGCTIYSPKTEGGKIYSIISDAIQDGEEVIHYDVNGMEIITPSLIMGSIDEFVFGIGMCVSYTDVIPELLSGVGPTSDYTMIAHLILLLLIIVKPPRIIIILGDDATFIGKHEIKSSVLYAQQFEDDRAERTLGLTCGKEVHPVYENVTVDSAPKAFDVELGTVVKNKMPIEDRWHIAELFTGYVNGQPLREILEKMKPESGVYSPKEMISKHLGWDIT